jgi:hypothetical protein
VDIVPRELFDRLVPEHKSDRYYKSYDSWTQFMTMLFGILSRRDSTTEIACGMQALLGKLNYSGLDTSPAKSTIGDGLRNRSETENRIKTQIGCTLIARLPLTVLKAKTKTKEAFSTVAAVIRIHLISYPDMYWLVENCSGTYSKKKIRRNKGPGVQLSLVFEMGG